MKIKEIFELKIIPEIEDPQGWSNYKQYYVKPYEYYRENNLVFVISYDKKWNSYNVGFFDLNDKFKNKKIEKKSDLKDLKLVANLSLLKSKYGYEVEVIGVERNYRGQGLAHKLYKGFLKYVDQPIISDYKLTVHGFSLWKKFFTSGEFIVKGLNNSTGEFFDVNLSNDKFISEKYDLYSSDDFRLALFLR